MACGKHLLHCSFTQILSHIVDNLYFNVGKGNLTQKLPWSQEREMETSDDIVWFLHINFKCCFSFLVMHLWVSPRKLVSLNELNQLLKCQGPYLMRTVWKRIVKELFDFTLHNNILNKQHCESHHKEAVIEDMKKKKINSYLYPGTMREQTSIVLGAI